MAKGTITNISIEDFQQYKMVLDYVDDDFIVATNLKDLPYNREAIRVNFFLIIFCEDGRLQLDINGKTYLLEKNDSIICLPTMIISRSMYSPDHKITMIGFSTKFLQRILKNGMDVTNTMKAIVKNPIHHIDRQNVPPAFHHYGELLLAKTKDPGQSYHKEILQYLFSALFLEMMSDIQAQNANADETAEEEELGQKNRIFGHFLRELAKDNGQHRSVIYYADRLCYSPKYISSVIKQVSGRTALDWINEVTIEQIKQALKHSDKSIKEIAEQFNFPNQSFFGKYVKTHLGMSPARYRHSEEV